MNRPPERSTTWIASAAFSTRSDAPGSGATPVPSRCIPTWSRRPTWHKAGEFQAVSDLFDNLRRRQRATGENDPDVVGLTARTDGSLAMSMEMEGDHENASALYWKAARTCVELAFSLRRERSTWTWTWTLTVIGIALRPPHAAERADYELDSRRYI